MADKKNSNPESSKTPQLAVGDTAGGIKGQILAGINSVRASQGDNVSGRSIKELIGAIDDEKNPLRIILEQGKNLGLEDFVKVPTGFISAVQAETINATKGFKQSAHLKPGTITEINNTIIDKSLHDFVNLYKKQNPPGAPAATPVELPNSTLTNPLPPLPSRTK